MSIGSYNPHRRYQERAAQRLAGLLKVFAFIIVSLVSGFWLGKQYGAEQLIVLKESIETLEAQREDLQAQVTESTASAQTANKRFEQLKEEVASILPEGPIQDLVTVLREQLSKGTDPERLSFVIRSTRPPTGCLDPDSKRFVVSTPANKGPQSIVQIADTITITGIGTSAQNQEGNPEAWFDQAKPVAITFKNGEEKEIKKGVLPIRHSMVVGNREYRFTIETGARSFAKVVFDSCNYP